MHIKNTKKLCVISLCALTILVNSMVNIAATERSTKQQETESRHKQALALATQNYLKAVDTEKQRYKCVAEEIGRWTPFPTTVTETIIISFLADTIFIPTTSFPISYDEAQRIHQRITAVSFFRVKNPKDKSLVVNNIISLNTDIPGISLILQASARKMLHEECHNMSILGFTTTSPMSTYNMTYKLTKETAVPKHTGFEGDPIPSPYPVEDEEFTLNFTDDIEPKKNLIHYTHANGGAPFFVFSSDEDSLIIGRATARAHTVSTTVWLYKRLGLDVGK